MLPFTVTSDRITLLDSRQRPLAEFNLVFTSGDTTWRVRALEEHSFGWTGTTDDALVTVKITQHQRHLCVELCGPFGPARDVTYFSASPIRASHLHAFIPDANLGSFSVAQDQTFTLTNQAAMRQRLGLKDPLWMLAPQPHVLAIGSETGTGFGISIPECLPSDAVQFVVANRTLEIKFLHHVAACDENRLPRVYLDLELESKSEALDRHLGHARDLGLTIADKNQPSWWHNPLYCTWGDQCRLGFHGIHKNASLTSDRILGWADKIRTIYEGEVNFIIDDGYFVGMGDFRLRPELYSSVAAFRELIDELKRRNFRVILWYTPFWVDKTALAITEHPEWLLRGTDSTLLDETGDWKGKYHFDWTHPELREHQRQLIRHFLIDLDADGFKIDMTYAHPPTRDVSLFDPAWAAGNQFCKRVIEFIHTEAVSIKPDVFLTANGVESYLQPYVSAIRLNDLFDFHNSTAWYHRAELVTRLMPGVAIDVDGWPCAAAKMREYPFVASVFGAPVTYYIDGTDIGDMALSAAELNRMASIWATYAHAPVRGDDQILLDVDNERFERRDATGELKAVSLSRKVFITYNSSIRVTTNAAMAVAVPLEKGTSISKAERVNRGGDRSSIPFYSQQDRVLFFAEDSGNGVLYYELRY